MKQADAREGARRQHRALGIFAILQCWIRNLDGVCLQSTHLRRIIGLKQFRTDRIPWLKEDLGEFFGHQVLILRKPKKDSSLFVARTSLASLPTGNMEDEERIRRIPEGLPRVGIFQLWPHLHGLYREPLKKDFAALIPFFGSRGNYDERMLTSYLSLLVSGQMPLRFLVDQIGKMDGDKSISPI